MRVRAMSVPGCWIVEADEQLDERGSSSRVFCDQELRAHGLEARVAQVSVAHDERRGTLRGLHVRHESNPACTMVRCTRGRSFHVVVDVRAAAPSYGRWESVELDDRSHRSLWVCEGVAHGVLTLQDDVEVLSLHNRPHAPLAEMGYRWDDPAFGIEWPFAPEIISRADRERALLGALAAR
jgi:dTDP-4-dehydrorhamnose 3,5-epimerase